MNRYKNNFGGFDKNSLNFLEKLLLFVVVIGYPILVSMYTMLPPLIGVAGYIILTNVNKNIMYALAGMLYLINLELNLTLPMLLSIFVVVMIYIFLYSTIKLLIRCHVCLHFVLMLLIDLSYYLTLFLYDAMFNTSTVINDMFLLYYIVVDILIGVWL